MKLWKRINDWCDRNEGWVVAIGLGVMFTLIFAWSVAFSNAIERMCK